MNLRKAKEDRDSLKKEQQKTSRAMNPRKAKEDRDSLIMDIQKGKEKLSADELFRECEILSESERVISFP